MRAVRLSLLAALLVSPGAVGAMVQQPDLDTVLTFEGEGLRGWGGGPPGTLAQDSAVVRSGRYSGRIERSGESTDFSSFAYAIPRDFDGDRLVLRGWLRTQDVTGGAGLWLRQDGRGGSVQFDNMQDRAVTGTTEWTEYTIDLPLDDRTRTVVMGALIVGDGTLWVDDLSLTVDGVATAEAPPVITPLPGAEVDTEFDDGSRIASLEPSATQLENLVLLGRVWGFVKYHHGRVSTGEANWDNELFRGLPSVLEAPTGEVGRQAISAWLARFGEPEPCEPCVQPRTDATIAADVDWIRDRDLLGAELSDQLRRIYERRLPDGDRYYAAQPTPVANPDFSNESLLPRAQLPDAGYRLLAVYRFWNIIEYWFPYRDILDADWAPVLEEFVPRVLAAQTGPEYQLAMMEMIARIDDTHANLWSHMSVQPPVGMAQLPVVTRFIDGQAVVTGFSNPELGPASGLRVGDVIEAIDGRPVSSLVSEWSPLYSASNEPTRLRDIARNLTRGPDGDVRISGTRADGDFALTAERVPLGRLDPTSWSTHDLPGPTFQRLSAEVAYLKLSSVAIADIPGYLAGAAGADVLVVDIRNYPNEFVVFALGGHFVTERTQHAAFSQGDPANPGAFFMREPVSLAPLQPHFPGKVAILVDETSLSQAEYTAMAFRAGPNAFVAGSTTAGADGNVSRIPLPGGLSSMISGIGVFYPDGTPTQRVGIVPDLEVRPTLEGIRAGRDEVLEAAVSQALGREWRMETR